jgi:hypothetical protein
MAFPDRPVTTSGTTEVSRFSCMKFLSVRGVSDYAGPSFGSRSRAIAGVAFLCSNGVGVPEVDFRSSIPGPPMPLSTLHVPPRGDPRKTRGQDGIRFLLSCRTLSFPTSCRFIPAHWSAPCLISLRRAPVGFADGTAATPITGAPAAYCSDIHTLRALAIGEALWSPYRGQVHQYGCVPRPLCGLVPRNIIGTSGFSTERYHASAEKPVSVGRPGAWKYRKTERFTFIFKICE